MTWWSRKIDPEILFLCPVDSDRPKATIIPPKVLSRAACSELQTRSLILASGSCEQKSHVLWRQSMMAKLYGRSG